ncbi:zinc ABC transporter substrate-binding protein AztC [Arthrobacter sp. 35W]|uniref:zinc ABC transporter substrate-binding protein AztC n=1 Tax=Arthrobacter sp. 35W TaxID=1132441 RepID=UPI000422932A|nr:zinc ABC transporter substrate-binding protein AztC [Arthrobacter sp. 35W]
MRRPAPAVRAWQRALAALLVLPLAAAAMAACSPSTAGGRGTIVATTNILGDVAAAIAGGEADVVVLMPAGADPHSFGISARQAAQLEQADLVVSNGLGLEENVLRHVQAVAAQGVPVVAATDAANPLGFGAGRSTSTKDPHFWTDPQRMAAVAAMLAEAVVEHVPGVDVAVVRERAADYGRQLADLDASMAASFAAIAPERRTLVTNHHVFGYLAQRFGFRVLGAVIPSGSTLASPSSSDLDSLATAIRDAGVRAIFADTASPQRLVDVLAQEAGLEVEVVPLYSESLGPAGSPAATYLDMMRFNTAAITTALAG